MERTENIQILKSIFFKKKGLKDNSGTGSSMLKRVFPVTQKDTKEKKGREGRPGLRPKFG